MWPSAGVSVLGDDILLIDSTVVPNHLRELVDVGHMLRARIAQGAWSDRLPMAISAYNAALIATVKYLEEMKTSNKPYDQTREWELAELWSNASTAISEFDPHLANRCFIKGQGWLDPRVWNDPRYRGFRIGIDDMREGYLSFTKTSLHDAVSQAGIHSWELCSRVQRFYPF
jgi:hypothetical protein